MKYIVIVNGTGYKINADYYSSMSDGVTTFWRDCTREPVKVAEFKANKIDGIIEE